MSAIYQIAATTAKGESTTVGSIVSGKVALIVNTASKCGFTPQLEGLTSLQTSYGPKGFTVVAYPCNQFGAQEPGDEASIVEFCSLKYKANYPIMKKVDVNGEAADPLWKYLKAQKGGFLGFDGMCVYRAVSPIHPYASSSFFLPSSFFHTHNFPTFHSASGTLQNSFWTRRATSWRGTLPQPPRKQSQRTLKNYCKHRKLMCLPVYSPASAEAHLRTT